MDGFLDTLGLQIFRRPLTESEKESYQGIYDVVSAGGTGIEGFQWVLTGLLQSPHFLYRAELGEHLGEGVYALDSYEIASQLSYLVWGSMPDSELFAAAASGELLDTEVREEQLQRLLADPKSRGQLAHFSNQWLEVNQLATVPKDAELYPNFTPEIREDMAEELTRWVNHVVWEGGGSLSDLFLEPSTMVTELAAYYGLEGMGEPDASGFALTSTEGSRRGVDPGSRFGAPCLFKWLFPDSSRNGRPGKDALS